MVSSLFWPRRSHFPLVEGVNLAGKVPLKTGKTPLKTKNAPGKTP